MTKSKLLASTMLVAAATAMSTVPANAVDLKIGGFGEYWIGYGDNDDAAGTVSNIDVKQDAELYFSGEATLDNGMKIGARFEFEAGNGSDNGGDGNTGFDESFAWVKTSFGQLNIGNNDLATGYVGGVSTVGPIGIIKSDADDWIPGNDTLNNTDVDLGLGDSQNITYFTPRVAGFQAIVSYTPDASDGGESDFDDQETTGMHNGASIALTYSGKFSGVSVGLSGGYTRAEQTDDNASRDNGEADGHTVRGSLGFGAFTVTGAYAREQAGDDDQFWGVSGLYTMGKHTFSLAYSLGTETQDGANIAQDEEVKLVTLGWERSLGKGATLGASLFKISRSGGGMTEAQANDGVGLVTGLKLKF
jgi:hypothetical protein